MMSSASSVKAARGSRRRSGLSATATYTGLMSATSPARPRDQKALHQIAAGIAAGMELLDPLHALGDDLGAEQMRKLDNARDEQPLAPVTLQPVDEEAVDLHIVGLPLVKSLQTREAGAEIVDGETEPPPAHGLHRIGEARRQPTRLLLR